MAAKVKALQAWCKAQCDGYRDVNITNMTSSWKSGLAFCAMIHRYRPDLIDYDSLSKENVFENNQLAFEVAERELNIPALLDAEDMVAMAVPDKLCIVTYVSQYYNHLANKEKLGGPGVKGKTATKRQLRTSDAATESKKALTTQTQAQPESGPKSSRRTTLTDVCGICKQKVYVMERHMDGSKLYHRRCIREQQRSLPRKVSNEKPFGFGFKNESNEGIPGKENKKPAFTSHMTSSATKPAVPITTTPNTGSSSSHLFTKINSAPKPYSGASVSTDLKIPTANSTLSKTNVPKPKTGYSSIDLGLSESNDSSASKAKPVVQSQQEKPDFKARFYGKKEENPLLKPRIKRTPVVHEPMDTGTQHDKYEIVGRVVNEPQSKTNAKSPVFSNKNTQNSSPNSGHVVTARTFAGSQPMSANVTQTNVNKAGDSGSDSQVLQGLLKNLAGVRSRHNPPNGNVTGPSTQGNDKHPTSHASEAVETPAFTKVVLKPTPKTETSPVIPKRPAPSVSPSTGNSQNEIPKPKQRHSKLISDQDKMLSPENGSPKSKYSPKPVLKNKDNAMDTNESSKYSPKPILKKSKDFAAAGSTEKRTSIVPHRTSPPTPPLSVFKSNDKPTLLDSVQLDSSDEFENKMDTSENVKGTCVIPTAPPRPSVAPVGVKKDISKGLSPDDKPKGGRRSPQPKTAWQIELEARQGIRQHEPKRPGVNRAHETNNKHDTKSSSEPSKPEWQIEAEKRQAQRKLEEETKNHNVSQPDSPPVAPPRRKAPPRPSSPPKFKQPVNSPPHTTGGPSYGGLDITGIVRKQGDAKQNTDNGDYPSYVRASVTSDEDPFGRTSKTRSNGGVSRKPAFRVDSKENVAELQSNGIPHQQDQTDLLRTQEKKKIVPDQRFTFSYDFEAQKDAHREQNDESQTHNHPWGEGMRNRPLPAVPTFSPPKRRVNAEERMAMHEIIEQLEHLDAALQVLEYDGRSLEDKIRLGTDDDMDEDVLMVQWFEIVNQKNELVRKETDLMFKKKQQELEDEHEDIEYELRCLLEKPEHLKTPSEKVREESLLQELMDTVSLRNSIVDSIEENRIKYIEEDKEIAQVMAMRGFCTNSVQQQQPEKPHKNGKKKKGKKNGKEKRNSNGMVIDQA